MFTNCAIIFNLGQDSLDEFPLGSDASMDDETFESLMGIHEAGNDVVPSGPGVEVYVSNPDDPNIFDTLPYEARDGFPTLDFSPMREGGEVDTMKGENQAASSSSQPETVEEMDARIALLQYFVKNKNI